MALKLRREVQTPQRQNTGLGVMLIASAAMFFAVAGSAFILQARMASECCPRAHTVSPPTTIVVDAPPETNTQTRPARNAAVECGKAIYRNNPDGTVSVTFPLCPEGSPALDTAPDSIEVILVEE